MDAWKEIKENSSAENPQSCLKLLHSQLNRLGGNLLAVHIGDHTAESATVVRRFDSRRIGGLLAGSILPGAAAVGAVLPDVLELLAGRLHGDGRLLAFKGRGFLGLGHDLDGFFNAEELILLVTALGNRYTSTRRAQ